MSVNRSSNGGTVSSEYQNVFITFFTVYAKWQRLPLLANLYLRRFVLAWKQRGLEQRLGSRIVTYADV